MPRRLDGPPRLVAGGPLRGPPEGNKTPICPTFLCVFPRLPVGGCRPPRTPRPVPAGRQEIERRRGTVYRGDMRTPPHAPRPLVPRWRPGRWAVAISCAGALSLGACAPQTTPTSGSNSAAATPAPTSASTDASDEEPPPQILYAPPPMRPDAQGRLTENLAESTPWAIVGLEARMPDCTQELRSVVIDTVEYDQPMSDTIVGFRTRDDTARTVTAFPIDSDGLYRTLANAERADVARVIHKGPEPVLVRYQVCGNGGHVSVLDLYRTDRTRR